MVRSLSLSFSPPSSCLVPWRLFVLVSLLFHLPLCRWVILLLSEVFSFFSFITLALGCHAVDFGNDSSWPCVFSASTLQFSLSISENMIDSLWAKNLSLAKLSGPRAEQDGSSSRKAFLIRRQQAEETLAGESDWHFSPSTISVFQNSDRWCVITYLHFPFFVIFRSVLRDLWIINKLFIDDDITYHHPDLDDLA